jgi:hypothetical protein
MVARFVVAFNSLVPRQKAIISHVDFLVIQPHNEGCTEVNDIRITDVRKQGVRKTGGIFIPQLVKIGFPEKIYERRQGRCGGRTMIIVLEMIGMKEFNVPHTSKLTKQK